MKKPDDASPPPPADAVEPPTPAAADAEKPPLSGPADAPVTAAAGDRPRTPELATGVRLGRRYVIERLIGEGGMGDVYLALDEALGTQVALKLLRGAGPDAIREEVRLAQLVTHPNVCRTFDLEEVDGRWLVKMEFVRGETLGERLADGRRLDVDEALEIARGVVAGLGAAHATGIVHRDLKPQNIMIEDHSGRVVLMDFGLARGGGGGAATPAGTPEYMAPEQALGVPIDVRADQYALGCVLYRMLVGDTPFRASSQQSVLALQLRDPPPDPRRARAELPPWLAALVCKLLDKDPAHRFADVQEVAEALQLPTERRRRRIAATVGALALAAAGGAALSQRLHAPVEWRPRVVEQQPAYEENSDAVALSPDGTRVAFPSDRDGNWRIYVGPFAGGSSHPITAAGPGRQNYPRWTRDGSALFFRNRVRGVYVVQRVSLADNQVTDEQPGATDGDDCGGSYVFSIYAAPDCADCGQLIVRNPDGSGLRELFHTMPGQRVRWPRCDAAGRRVVFGVSRRTATLQDRGALWMVPLAGGEARALVDDGMQNEYPSFHPDGRSILFSSVREGAANIWELTLEGPDRSARQVTSGGVDFAPAVTPDGHTLTYNADTTSLPLFEYDGAGHKRQLSHTLADFEWPVAAPDGHELVADARRQGHSELRAISLGDGEERALGGGERPAFSRDGHTLYFAVPEHGQSRVLAIDWPSTEHGRPLARLPGLVDRLIMGGDGALHLAVAGDGDQAAWRLPLDGPPEREAPAPYTLVVPAPVGGWRFAQRKTSPFPEVELWPPGALLEPSASPGPRRVRMAGAVWQPDGRAIIGWDGTHVVRAGLDGTIDEVRESLDFAGLAVSPDGRKIYGCELVGHVRRMLVPNFGERPRPR
jgi:Tol biopolymer transport system component/predicted Ser/Thr protein kinase